MTIFENVQKVISENLNIDKEKVTLEADLAKDLGADSIDAVDIVMDLEDCFGISFDDANDTVKTVKDLVEFIENAQK